MNEAEGWWTSSLEQWRKNSASFCPLAHMPKALPDKFVHKPVWGHKSELRNGSFQLCTNWVISILHTWDVRWPKTSPIENIEMFSPTDGSSARDFPIRFGAKAIRRLLRRMTKCHTLQLNPAVSTLHSSIKSLSFRNGTWANELQFAKRASE